MVMQLVCDSRTGLSSSGSTQDKSVMRTKSVLVAATTALVVWGTWQTATAQPLPVDVNSFVGEHIKFIKTSDIYF